jgi:autotransporter-associated beta strand protein
MSNRTYTFSAKAGFLILASAAALLAATSPAAAQFSDKVTTTPAYLQDGFGPAGDCLSYGGQAYCVPTAASMLLGYLGKNGFNQIGPSDPTSADGLNLVRVMAGLMNTDALQGTPSISTMTGGLKTYLAAKGIAASDYTLTTVNLPTMSELTSLNQNQTVVELLCGYYKQSGITFQRGGGHGVALLAQGVDASGQPSPSTLAIGNPLPCAFAPEADVPANAVQYLNTVSTSINGGMLALDPSQYPDHWGDVLCGIETAIALTVNASQQSVNSPAPATWTLSSMQMINLQNGYLSVLVPMQGTGGIAMGDGGTLDLKAADNASGSNVVASGTLRSNITSGLPFGSGMMQLQAGRLELAPAIGVADVSLAIASEKYLAFVNGAELALNRNGNNSLKVSIGGRTDGSALNLSRLNYGTLVIAPSDGVAALGTTEQVTVPGSGLNLPTLMNGIVAPYIVAKDSDGFGSGDFLTYGTSGFTKAAYVQASTTPITSAGRNAVFEADVAQTIPSSTMTQVYALKVGPVTVGGGSQSALSIGLMPYSGLILDGGAISTSSLIFGGEGAIYCSQAGGTISSSIMATGGLTTFGPGELTLTGANPTTSAIHVNSGTLVAASIAGPTMGSATVTVEQNATLKVTGISGGGTTLKNGATLLLDGGTVTGSLVMNSGSYLFGHGTITGGATITGTIGNYETDATAPTYSGVEHITFRSYSARLLAAIYSWRLDALDDNPANAGTNWSLLDFLVSGSQLGTQSAPLFLALDFGPDVADPNSGNVFWNQSHQWLVADTSDRFSSVYLGGHFPAFVQGEFSPSLDAASRNLYISYVPYSVPEPGTLAILALGVLGLLAWTQRRNRKTPGAPLSS